MSTLDITAIRRILAELSDAELERLTVLALEDRDATCASWSEAAARYEVRYSESRALSGKDLVPLRDKLLATGLLSPSYSAARFELPAYASLEVLTACHARGRLDPLAEVLDRRERRSRFVGYGPEVQTTRLRLAALLGRAPRAKEAIDHAFIRDRDTLARFLVQALGLAPQPAWLEVLPRAARSVLLLEIVNIVGAFLLPIEPALIELALADEDKKIHLGVARLLAVRGDVRPLTALGPLPRWGAEGVALLQAFWSGRHADAAALGRAALAKMTSRKHKLLPDLEGACHLLALAATSSGNPRATTALGATLSTAMEASTSTVADDVVMLLEDVHRVLTGGSSRPFERRPDPARVSAFASILTWLLHVLWVPDEPKGRAKPKPDEFPLVVARSWLERARANGYEPAARELSAIVTALEGGPRTHLAGAFAAPERWQAALASLEAAVEISSLAASGEVPARRLVWEVDASRVNSILLQPRIIESTRSKRGRAVSVRQLLDGSEDALLDAADRAVLSGFGVAADQWPAQPLQGPRALVALIGHPRVISKSGEPLTVERGTPSIVTNRRKGHTHVELRPASLVHHPVVLELTSPRHAFVYERPATLEPLVSVLADGSDLAVPDAAHDRLVRTLTQLGAVAPVNMEGDVPVAIETREADPRPLVQLRWDGATLDVRLRVAPLGPTGPCLRPGIGAETCVGEVSDGEAGGGASKPDGTSPRIARCERELPLERARARAVLDACPVLEGFSVEPLHCRVPTLPDALDVLLEIDALGESVALAWAGKQRLALPRLVELDGLTMEVGARPDWLALTASFAVEEGEVLRFAQLLGKRIGERYLPIGPDRFLALSDALRRRLDALASLGTVTGEELRASPALLSVLEDLTAGTDVTFDPAVRTRLDALEEIGRWSPRLPRGFQATLRDYQREGYTWLSRLARAGLGACLADDMGLGKTVQALALLCQRARLGPAMVVCPTSVVHNWAAETERFTSVLRVHVLADHEDRAQLLRALRSRDLVLCSYGLLSSVTDTLAEVEFSTVVFDEAHALKNQETKRAAAARLVRAEHRLALTGTPVENHLGELWSLFQVILPGLLGSRARFDDAFAAPIAAGNRERSTQLRALLRPFLLRRTKAQVLDELPPRSDITIHVEPHPKERAFYEALRRRAVERVANADPKKVRFAVLAELTRLRQAAIDPRLVDEAKGPKGAKLDVLMERLEQLRDEGHRALVFTQFLGSMALVRERLQAAGIEYLDLDGSTPAAERARRIDAFQAGEGDVFVLSLRAGGVGVNLTGADYVFHLDPWWNPAVEDQATDRAHRIGQQRPVTVYRLVSEGTIEDKVMALHETKRQLADDVLTGHERAAIPNLDALRELLEA